MDRCPSPMNASADAGEAKLTKGRLARLEWRMHALSQGQATGSTEESVHARMEEMEASVEGRCSFLDGRLGYLENSSDLAGKLEKKMQDMQQHLDVLQAQTDMLQTQVQKETKKVACLTEALSQSNKNFEELCKRQRVSSEAIQRGLHLVMTKLHGGSEEVSRFDFGSLGGELKPNGGEDCMDALHRLREKLTMVAGDLAADLNTNGPFAESEDFGPLVPLDSCLSQALSSPSQRVPPKLPSRRQSHDFSPIRSTTLLGRTSSQPCFDALKPDGAAQNGKARSRAGSRSPAGRACLENLSGAPTLGNMSRQRSTSRGRTEVPGEILELQRINAALREENQKMQDSMPRPAEAEALPTLAVPVHPPTPQRHVPAALPLHLAQSSPAPQNRCLQTGMLPMQQGLGAMRVMASGQTANMMQVPVMGTPQHTVVRQVSLGTLQGQTYIVQQR